MLCFCDLVTSIPHTAPSKASLWAGRIISAIPVLMLLLSGVMKLVKPAPVLASFARFGYPVGLLSVLGIIEITCTLIYIIPRTSILGAILLTGYLGGATATHVRIQDPSFVMTVILGVLVWVGLYLREQRLRALLPLRS